MAYDLAQMPYPMKAVGGPMTATATRTAGTFKSPRGDVVALEVISDTSITGDNTNRYTVAFKKGTIGSPTTIATIDLLTGTNLVANVPYSVTLPTGSAANDALRALVAGDVLHAVITKNGTAANIGWLEAIFHVIPTIDYANRSA